MKINAFILIILMPFSLIAKWHYQLSVCAIFQDEAPYLKEWIDYHHSIGVEHFYLYNNNSSDEYLQVLEPYIVSGLVDLTELPSDSQENDFMNFCFTVQPKAYNDALAKAKLSSKWLAVIDVDEFCVTVKEKSLSKLLNESYDIHSGVCVNWQCYGTSHITLCNSGEMLEKLTWKMRWDHPRNLYYKSIVKTECVSCINNPHLATYLPGYFHVNAIHDPIQVENTGVYIEDVRINHYWTRDEWHLNNVKIPRYEKWGCDSQYVLDLAQEMNVEYDPILSQGSGEKD